MVARLTKRRTALPTDALSGGQGGRWATRAVFGRGFRISPIHAVGGEAGGARRSFPGAAVGYSVALGGRRLRR